MVPAESKGDVVKKHTPKKKLALQRETLTNLERAGGASQINHTVYYPPKKQLTDACGGSIA